MPVPLGRVRGAGARVEDILSGTSTSDYPMQQTVGIRVDYENLFYHNDTASPVRRA